MEQMKDTSNKLNEIMILPFQIYIWILNSRIEKGRNVGQVKDTEVMVKLFSHTFVYVRDSLW